jgi:hypothetical protein
MTYSLIMRNTYFQVFFPLRSAHGRRSAPFGMRQRLGCTRYEQKLRKKSTAFVRQRAESVRFRTLFRILGTQKTP